MLCQELKKLFPTLEIPVLVKNKDGDFISFTVKNIKDLEDNLQIALPEQEFVDYNKKYICLGKELYYLMMWGLEDDHIVKEMDEIEQFINEDTKNYFINLHKEKVEKPRKDLKLEVGEHKNIFNDSIKQDLPDIKCETMIELKENIKQDIPIKPIHIPKNENNNNSIKSKIVQECLIKNPSNSLDNNTRTDILGRVWDVQKLKQFKGWEILLDCLEKGYPPYLANDDKEEIELLNKAFIEKTGRKAFA